MSFAQKAKRLREIVWDESGASKAWGALLTIAPPLIQWSNDKWPDLAQGIKPVLDLVQWWWGALAFAAWVIWCLARKIFEYEMPVIEEPTFFKHGQDWHMHLRAKGKGKFQIVINFEVYNADGSLFLPDMFGYLWHGMKTNPVGIHGGGDQRTIFAKHSNGMAHIWGTDPAGRGVQIDLPKGSYIVAMTIHAGAEIRKKVNVLNDGSAIYVS
jgi:hypothetical protein